MSIESQIQEVKSAIRELKNYSMSGDIQTHEAMAIIKQSGLTDFLDIELKEIQSEAISQLQHNFIEHGKKSYKDGNFIYTVRSGTTRYYFTEIEEYKQAKEKLDLSTEKAELKRVESKYKTAFLQKQKGITCYDEDTGEEINVNDVNVVYSASSLSVKPR